MGIRFSSWIAGFQLEKRIPKTTFITGRDRASALKAVPSRYLSTLGLAQVASHPLSMREGLGSSPGLFIGIGWGSAFQAADPQDNLHHGPLSGGIGWGSAFRAGMPDSSSKSGASRQPSSRAPFRRDWLAIRFSSWIAGFQLEKRIPKTTFITGPFQEGLAGDPLFELDCRIPARKVDPQDNLHHGP